MTELRTAIPEEIDRYLESLVSTGPFASKAELVRAALAAYTSMAGPMAQVFDKDNIYSPDGRVYQIEYARESAMRGAPALGIVYRNGVLLASKNVCPSPLMNYSKIVRLSNEVAVCPSGILADGYVAIRSIRKEKPRTLEDLIDTLTLCFWENNSNKGKRPLGAILLVACVFKGQQTLLRFDPSGSHRKGLGVVVGKGYTKLQARLDLSYTNGSAKDAEALAEHVLGRPEKTEQYEMMHLKRT